MKTGIAFLKDHGVIAAAATLALGVSLLPAEGASAHHYDNTADQKKECTNGYANRNPVRPPAIEAINVTGSPETGYDEDKSGESHVRTVAGTLVGDVGGYAPAGGNPINNVTPRTAATPAAAVPGPLDPITGLPTTAAPARTITNFCAYFDDPFRAFVYETVGSRENFTGAPDTPAVGPGQRGIARDVGHQYVQPGYYEPFLYAKDDKNAWSDKVVKRFYINGPPSAGFGFSGRARVNQPVTFTSSSKDWVDTQGLKDASGPTENGPLTQTWDLDGNGTFGDATGPSATTTYTTEASRTVSLRVTDRWGTQRTASIPLSFNNLLPRPAFTSSPAAPVAGEPIVFASRSTDPDGSVARVEWDFNSDGKYDDASGSRVSKTFRLPGRYPISMRVTDDNTPTPGVATLTQTVVLGAPGRATGAVAAATRRFLVARIRLRATLTGQGARLNTIGVTTARGATVRVRCKGGGCKAKRQTLRSRGKLLRLKRFQRSYRAGTVLQLYVTEQGSIGRYVRVKIRKGKAPIRTDLCLRPGARRPTRC